MAGPAIRTDLVDVYVFRRCAQRRPQNPTRGGRSGDVEFLQMRRAAGTALAGTWQPVIGHVVEGETAARAALRELREETGIGAASTGVPASTNPPQRWPGDTNLLGFWQLEQPNIFFLHRDECVVISPCFAARVARGSEPTLNAEHDALRWVPRDHARRAFVWPGQRLALRQIVADILEPDSPVERLLRLDPRSVEHLATRR